MAIIQADFSQFSMKMDIMAIQKCPTLKFLTVCVVRERTGWLAFSGLASRQNFSECHIACISTQKYMYCKVPKFSDTH